MKHFLVTRFNLTVEGWKTSKKGELVLTEKWLKNRFHLFENYCLPSVINQSNQNFYWCVFFNTNTPEKYKDYIKSIAQNYNNFIPFYINGNNKLIESFNLFISQSINQKDEFIITTRLDNDDLIHKNFIDTIQKLSKPIDKMVIDLRNGYSITLKNNYSEIRKFNNFFNPFISLVEKSNCVETILSKMHQDWSASKHIIVFENSRLWVELVHEENKLNTTKKALSRVNKINNSDFGLTKPFLFKENRIQLIIINIKLYFRSVLRELKTIIKKVAKK